MIPEPCRYHELFDALEAGLLSNAEMNQLVAAGENGTLRQLFTTWKDGHSNPAFRIVCEHTLSLLAG